MRAVFVAVVAFLTVKLAVLAHNMRRFPILAPGPAPAERVSLLVPMRDEADRLAETLPSIAAQHVAELVILDDCSTDASAELARELTMSVPRARIVTGRPTPPGWAGKTWACHQLAELAGGDVLVFCDADIQLAPGAIAAVLAEMRRQRAGLFSVFPRQITATWAEHSLVPLIDDVLLCLLPFALLDLDAPSAATANGSIMAFDRPTYERLGGFAAVRDAVVEDVAMARHARRRGVRLGLALGGPFVATRMYRGYRAITAGMGRGLRPVVGSRAVLGAGLGWHALAYTMPAVLAPGRRRWLLPLGLALAERLAVEAKTGRRAWWQASLGPISPLAALPVVARAMRPRQEWRGREYAL